MRPAATEAHKSRASLEEERDFLLRSLKDLEAERAAGDLDDESYTQLRGDYTARAAEALRRLELLDRPRPNEASLAHHPHELAPSADSPSASPSDGPSPQAPPPVESQGEARMSEKSGARLSRSRRRVAVGVAVGLVLAAGAGWAVLRQSGTRLPGAPITGQAVGQEKVAKLLLAGQQRAAKGDGVGALRYLDQVLALEPDQIQALVAEGWIRVQTQEPKLVEQGIALLRKAEGIQPSYPPTHLYLGVAYLIEKDYNDALAPLQWYMANNPDPALVPRVRQALSQAQAGIAAAAAAAKAGIIPAGTVPAAGP